MSAGMSKIRSYLELFRMPGVFSAHADILAGFFIAGGGWNQRYPLLLLLMSSSAFFFAGMALNDLFDYDIDRIERPGRPLPSGRVSLSAAAGAGGFFLAAGMGLAGMAGPRSLIASIGLCICILSYDAKLKHFSLLGPLNMGACRYINFFLGMSVMPISAVSFLIPLLTGLFIFNVTALSRYEAAEDMPVSALRVCGIGCILVFGLYALLFMAGVISREIGVFFCLIWLSAVLYWISGLYYRHQTSDIQKVVKMLLLSLIILDGAIVGGTAPLSAAAAVCLLICPALWAARWIYVT